MSLESKISAHLHAACAKGKCRPGNQGTPKNVDKKDHFEEKGQLGGKTPPAIHGFAETYRAMIVNKKSHDSAKLPKSNGRHPGFKKVQSKIQSEGYSRKVAGAILAARTRSASRAAHKSNPRLNRVKG